MLRLLLLNHLINSELFLAGLLVFFLLDEVSQLELLVQNGRGQFHFFDGLLPLLLEFLKLGGLLLLD